MSESYLAKLENAFLVCSELNSTDQQRSYISNLAKTDSKLALELRSILALKGEHVDLFEMSGAQFCSIMFTTLGEEKKTESKNDLIDFLKLVSPSDQKDGIANLNGIELKELVGVGATGFVFKGWDTNLSRSVAVKILAPSIATNYRHRKAFADEARLASALKSRHIISIYHIYSDSESSLAYFVTEWIEGFTLQRWIIERPSNDYDALQETWIKQLFEAVSVAHENGIIHRDLKPANILIQQETQDVVLIDFGLAFQEKDWRDSKSPKGTPLYMSPEQLKGEPLSPQSDLFALAEITCLLLYGCHPFQEATINALTHRVLSEEPSFSTQVPSPVQQVFRKALSKAANQRHDSVQIFHEELKAVRNGVEADRVKDREIQEVDSTPPKPWATRLGQRRLALFAFVLLVALSSLFIWIGGLDTNEDLIHQDLPFTNFLGMTFEPTVLDPMGLGNWPSKNEDSEGLFSKVDWRNHEQVEKMYIANQFVTNEQYSKVMGKNPSKFNQFHPVTGVKIKQSLSPDAPVTGVNFFEAQEFARKLSELSPRNLEYFVLTEDEFRFRMYGEDYFSGAKDLEQISSDFEVAIASLEDRTSGPIPFPLANSFGDIKEWSKRELRIPVKQEGVVSYQDVPSVAASRFLGVMGGCRGELFVHVHDMNFGMNDFLIESSNLERFIEEDGNTSYLSPIKKDETGTLTYRYEFEGPLKTANISDPFSLHSESSSAGLKIRAMKEGDQEKGSELPWVEVFRVDGLQRQSTPLRNFDITNFVEGCTALEVQYWIKSGADKLNYSQLGRTTMQQDRPLVGYSNSLPDVFRMEAWIDRPSDGLLMLTPVPARFRSEKIGFRVMFKFKSRPSAVDISETDF